MRLYASSQSERACKGQGGNREVVVTLTIDPVTRKEIGRVVMKYEAGKYTVYYYPITANCTGQALQSGRVLLYEEEEEKPKMPPCIHGHPDWNCPKCLARIFQKGKKEKGET